MVNISSEDNDEQALVELLEREVIQGGFLHGILPGDREFIP